MAEELDSERKAEAEACCVLHEKYRHIVALHQNIVSKLSNSVLPDLLVAKEELRPDD